MQLGNSVSNYFENNRESICKCPIIAYTLDSQGQGNKSRTGASKMIFNNISVGKMIFYVCLCLIALA